MNVIMQLPKQLQDQDTSCFPKVADFWDKNSANKNGDILMTEFSS